MINIAKATELYKKIVFIGIALLTFISCSYLSFADTVILKNGIKLKGQIIEETVDEIKLKLKFDVTLIKKEDIKSIKREEITEDLIFTKDGIKDQWGFFIPPRSIDVRMMTFYAIHKQYLSMAEEYERKTKMESIPELQQARLMTALVYYRHASKSSSIKESSQLGIERCSAVLFNPVKDEIAIPYAVMTEHIEHFISELNGAKKKRYTDIYFEMGKDYEAKADKNKSSNKQLKDMGIAINCYRIVMTYSPNEESKLLAHENYQRCSKKSRDIYIAEENE